MMFRTTALRGAMLALAWGLSAAHATTLTMDLTGAQAVHGLWVDGVRFSYLLPDGTPSADASVPTYAVGELLHVQDPVLDGSTDGLLMLDFDLAVTDVSFGLALQSEFVQTDAVWVQAWLGNSVQDQRWLSPRPEVLFAEARYELRGLSVDRLQLSFATPGSRFVFDNLSFTPVASSVPEPATAVLWLAGLMALKGLQRRAQLA